MNKRRIVICAGGLGNACFTTDSTPAVRAAELQCNVIMKATKVDGVYNSDPVKNADATFYPILSYQKVIYEGLQVMETAAIAVANEHKIPIIVFSIYTPGAIMNAVRGKGRFTIIQ